MKGFNTQHEIISWGYKAFKRVEHYPHTDKEGFENGAEYAFDFAMQEFRTLIVNYFGMEDKSLAVVEHLIKEFEHNLGYKEYDTKRNT